MIDNIKFPLYECSIDSRECLIELRINNTHCFSTYKNGGIAVIWPLNPNILTSGEQSYFLQIKPGDKKTNFHTFSSVTATITVRDAFDYSLPKLTIKELQIPVLPTTELLSDKITITGLFEANVPYSQIGWKNSVHLEDENLEDLYKELDIFNKELLDIFKTKSITRYKNLVVDKMKEVPYSFYLDEIDIKNREKSFIPNFLGLIQNVNIENYRISFYGKGQLLGLSIPNEPLGFKFFSDNPEDNIVYEHSLFHRKHKGAPLTLIR